MWTPTLSWIYSLQIHVLSAIPRPVEATFHVSLRDVTATTVPSYVLEYGESRNIFYRKYSNNSLAPMVWLHSEEAYMPSDIGEQLVHTTPMVNWKPIDKAPSATTLDNLDQFNNLGNTSVYLTSKEGIDADPQPSWFGGVKPDQDGRTQDAISSTIILRDHGDGTLDAFYFYFYAWVIFAYSGNSPHAYHICSFNQGNTVLAMEFGDHVGDWSVTRSRNKSTSETDVVSTGSIIWYGSRRVSHKQSGTASMPRGRRLRMEQRRKSASVRLHIQGTVPMLIMPFLGMYFQAFSGHR